MSTTNYQQRSAAYSRDLLVVDDDPTLRKLMRMVFEDVGFMIHEAPDGATALHLLRTVPKACVVLLDLMLPVMSGSELLDLLFSDEELSPLLERHKFIILSATPQKAYVYLAPVLSACNIPVLSKPFQIDQLVAAVIAATNSTRASEQPV